MNEHPDELLYLRGPAGEFVLKAQSWRQLQILAFLVHKPPNRLPLYDSQLSAEQARELAADLRAALKDIPDETPKPPYQSIRSLFGGPRRKQRLRELIDFAEAGPFECVKESER